MRGHWRANCPTLSPDPSQPYVSGPYYSGPGTNNEFQLGPVTNNVQVMSSKGHSDTYIDISLRGRNVSVLLDTGCERNTCPLRLCRNAKITPAKAELFAANSTPIHIVGITRLFFTVNGRPMHADVYVTEDIDEIIFGYEFLVSHECVWTFGQRQIVIDGL